MPSAIVTGSDSGIGRAAAVLLASRGWDVGITWHRDEPGAERTAAEVRDHGRRAEVAALDLSDARAGARVVAELTDALGGLDALVCNAGTGDTTPAAELELDRLRHILEVDVVGQLACMQEAARRWIAGGRGGRIVCVTSVHEHIPLPGSTAYVAAKHALGGVVKVAALEWARHGITVNAVAPGEIATAMTGNEDVPPESVDRPAIPLGRPGHASEMAEVIAFLCSDASSYVTGASWIADGGLSLMAAVQDRTAP